LSVVLNPLLGSEVKELAIALVLPCDLSVLRVIWLCSTKQSLQGNKRCSNGESRRPFVFQDVKANSSSLGGNVWMPYFSVKLHLGWLERIIRRNLDINLENSANVWGIVL